MIHRSGFSGGTIDLAKIIFLFQSVDCVLPAKLGDVYGAHLMKLNFSMSRSFSLGSIFLWRVLDFLVVMASALIVAFMLFGRAIPLEVVFGMKVAGPGLVALALLMGLFFHYHKRVANKLKSERLRAFIDSFRRGLQLNKKILPFLLLLTAITWFLEAGRFYFLCKSMGVEASWIVAIFTTSSAAFLTAIPSLPRDWAPLS